MDILKENWRERRSAIKDKRFGGIKYNNIAKGRKHYNELFIIKHEVAISSLICYSLSKC